MPELPMGKPPDLSTFLDQVRAEFAFLVQEFGFREEPVPTAEDPYLNRFAVWFANPRTRVVVEGIHWGANARVAVGGAGTAAAFENFDLEDLLAIRDSAAALGSQGGARGKRPGQLEQLHRYAAALRRVATDVLRGDHSIFPALAARVEWRRAEFAAGRDPRV